MYYIIIAYDGIDDQALKRRLAARDDHLSSSKESTPKGRGFNCAPHRGAEF